MHKQSFYIKIISLPAILLVIGSLLIGVIQAGSPTDEDQEVVFDYECQRRIVLTTVTKVDGNPFCSLLCQKGVIYEGDVRKQDSFCKFGTTNEEVTDSTALPEIFIPQEDAALIYLRSGLYVVFGIAGLTVILYGLYGWYIRSMSGGEPDKVKEAMSIYKNAILGVIIVFAALLIVQMVYVVLGITSSPFDFNFIPKIGTQVDVKEVDLGRKCFSSQVDTNGIYKCVCANELNNDEACTDYIWSQ